VKRKGSRREKLRKVEVRKNKPKCKLDEGNILELKYLERHSLSSEKSVE